MEQPRETGEYQEPITESEVLISFEIIASDNSSVTVNFNDGSSEIRELTETERKLVTLDVLKTVDSPDGTFVQYETEEGSYLKPINRAALFGQMISEYIYSRYPMEKQSQDTAYIATGFANSETLERKKGRLKWAAQIVQMFKEGKNLDDLPFPG